MIGSARLILRQAHEALGNERLEEAHRLLALGEVRGHRSAEPLLKQLAQSLVQRGERRLSSGESEAAWGDLLRAEQTGSSGNEGHRLRHALAQRGLDQVRVLLAAGEPARAIDAVVGLAERGLRGPDLDPLSEAARSWLMARESADRGDFAPAVTAVERAKQLLNKPVLALENFRVTLEQRQDLVASLLVPLHAAAEQGHWGEVLVLSDKLLAAAPDHKEARRLRARAWRSVEPDAATLHSGPPTTLGGPLPSEKVSQRFLLWVDGVGGYLVCLGARVTLGQASCDTLVDVPLQADVSRVHAAIVRDGEGYLLEAVRPARVNGQPVERVLLQPNDAIALGTTCQLSFRQASPVSASARLDVVSGHRLPLALDGVLLMADTLVLGPGSHAHVSLPEAHEPVILYRHKDGLGVQYGGKLTVDGQAVSERGVMSWTGAVAGDDFAFTVESVGARLGRAG